MRRRNGMRVGYLPISGHKDLLQLDFCSNLREHLFEQITSVL